MSKLIPLSRGLFATVDDADFDWLNQWKWSALKTGRKNGLPPKFYACRVEQRDKKQKMILMHRLITDAETGKPVDHRDLDTLNNRRKNLRVCTHGQNSMNQHGHRDRKGSRFKGVYPHQGKWAASLRGKYLGIFSVEEDAAKAYDRAAVAAEPEFAVTNFELEAA